MNWFIGIAILVVVGYLLDREVYFYEGVHLGPRVQAWLYDRWSRKYDEGKRESQLRDDEMLAQDRALHPTWDEETLRLWSMAKRQLDSRVHNAEIVTSRPWRELLAGVRCPTLVITSDPGRGGIVSEAIAREALTLNPKLEWVHIAGVGHHIRFEAPAPYNQAVINYLGRIYKA